MRIGSQSQLSGINAQINEGALPQNLKAGDSIKVKVLANEEGVTALKTQDGLVLRAKMENGAVLTPGQTVTLVVNGKADGIIYMSISSEEASALLASGGGEQGSAQTPVQSRELDGYMNALRELGIRPNTETAEKMRELISDNPKMTVEEAAFLAANNIESSGGARTAAHALIADGAKLDSMLAQLKDMLSQQVSAPGTTGFPDSARNNGVTEAVNVPVRGVEDADYGNAGTTASQTDDSFLEVAFPKIAVDAPPVAQIYEKAQFPDFSSPVGGGIPDAPRVNPEQSTAPAVGDVLDAPQVNPEKITAFVGGNIPDATITTPVGDGVLDAPRVNPEQSTGSVGADIPENMKMLPELKANDYSPLQAVLTQPPTETERALIKETLTHVFSELSEFKNVLPRKIAEFAGLVVDTAIDSGIKTGNTADKLSLLLDKMFARIDESEPNLGAVLKRAKEELPLRLELFSEAAANSGLSGKEALIRQVANIAEQVKLSSQAEQYIYMQLPVVLNNEQKTAELYIYKRKNGSKKIDPDNVNILLALDLTHLGRWEALVGIRGKDVNLDMTVDTERAKEVFDSSTAKIHALLREIGYRLTGSKTTVEEAKTNPATALLAPVRPLRSAGVGIDLIA